MSLAERIRKAEDVWSRLESLAAGFEPTLREAFLHVVRQIRNRIRVKELERLLNEGDVQAVVRYVLGGGPELAGLYIDELTAEVRAASIALASDFSSKIQVQRFRTGIRFDEANPKALESIRNNTLDLIREVDRGTRDGLRTYITQQLTDGVGPRNLIPQIVGYVGPDGTRSGGILGLTARQTQAVLNYRRYLTEGRPEALERALRDHRYDRRVQQGNLTPEEIDFLVGRYEARYLAYRAETVARTESIRALSAGQRASWEDAISRRLVDPNDLVKVWHTAKDERVREAHRKMQGVTVRYNESFMTDDMGAIWGPPLAIQCRCVCFVKPVIRRVV